MDQVKVHGNVYRCGDGRERWVVPS